MLQITIHEYCEANALKNLHNTGLNLDIMTELKGLDNNGNFS